MPSKAEAERLTEEQCDEFRRHPGTFNEMVQAIFDAGRTSQTIYTRGSWRPIETAPKDGTHILVCRARNADGEIIRGDSFGIFVQRAAWWNADGWVCYCDMVQDPTVFFEPTHWMPIPPFV